MAQACSYTRICTGGFDQPTVKASSGVNPSGYLIAKVTLAATSVSDGMVCDVSNDLKAECYGVTILGRTVGKEVDYDIEALPPVAYTSSQVKFRVRRCSTGSELSAAVDLSGESFIAMFIGY